MQEEGSPLLTRDERQQVPGYKVLHFLLQFLHICVWQQLHKLYPRHPRYGVPILILQPRCNSEVPANRLPIPTRNGRYLPDDPRRETVAAAATAALPTLLVAGAAGKYFPFVGNKLFGDSPKRNHRECVCVCVCFCNGHFMGLGNEQLGDSPKRTIGDGFFCAEPFPHSFPASRTPGLTRNHHEQLSRRAGRHDPQAWGMHVFVSREIKGNHFVYFLDKMCTECMQVKKSGKLREKQVEKHSALLSTLCPRRSSKGVS